MKKLRLRVARGLVQRHVASDWGDRDLNPGGLPKASVLAQWSRTCLPMPEMQVRSLGREKVRDASSIDGEEHGNPLQYSCLENPLDRGAWRATVHGVTKQSDTT